jgi:hypothetical protein
MVWRYQGAGEASATRLRKLLDRGEEMQLYRLRSWVAINGEVRALMAPAVPVDEITQVVRRESCETVSTRWVRDERACTNLVREIETAPVHLGLAARPEEWPFSSAASE